MDTRVDRREQGNVMIGMLVVLVAVGGLAATLLTRSSQTNTAALNTAEVSRLLFVAEAGLNYNFVQMEVDSKYAVKDTTGFTWDDTAKEFVSKPLKLRAESGTKQRDFELRIQYSKTGAPVTFASRTTPTEKPDAIRVRSTARSQRARRTVTAWYGFSGYRIGGAIVCDAIPTGPAEWGKNGGKLGHVSMSESHVNQFYVYGDILANGSICYDDKTAGEQLLTDANASSLMATFNGTVQSNLAGTANEIPDLTSIGADKQLFDFARFRAAAAAGAGQVFTSSNDFNVAMEAAIAAGNPLEGIIYVEIDPSGSNDDFEDVWIRGTFVVKFADGTDPFEKIQCKGYMNVNPADLTSVVPSDETTYTTGYPAAYADATKKPSAVDITGGGFDNFGATEDTPAVMYNNGVLDIHGAINICGVTYGASFLEIENKNDSKHYFNGAVFAGGGVWFDSGGDGSSATMIRYDRNTVDDLTTMDTAGGGSGSTLVRRGYSVSGR